MARRGGIELHDDPWEMNVRAVSSRLDGGGGQYAHLPSMLEDVRAHRATEVDFIAGALVREAERPACPRRSTRRCGGWCEARNVRVGATAEVAHTEAGVQWWVVVRSGPVRGPSRASGGGRGVGLRPRCRPRRGDKRAWTAPDRRGRGRRSGAGHQQRRGAARRATSASWPPRQCTPRRRSPQPPTRSPGAQSARSRTASATRRPSQSTLSA